MKKLLTLSFCISISIIASSQTKKLHHSINSERTNSINPKLSADGKQMLYSSDLGESNKELNFCITKYAGNERWSSPYLASDVLNFGKVNSFGGYFISYDDSKIIFSSSRSRGVGGFDIWMVDKNGDELGTPTNLGKPFNSEEHEGDPSLSPDENELYFCKCKTMSRTTASGCKIVISKRKGNGYGAPVDLPTNINTGNSMSPIILADGKTLVFASDKMGGKGGLDLFLSKKQDDGGWTDPISLEYLNTQADERYISIPASGDIAYYSKEMDGLYSIVKSIIPENLRQDNLMWIKGNIERKEEFKPVVQVTNVSNNQSTNWNIDNDGNYSLFLPKGSEYDVSIRDLNGKHWYTSYNYDLTNLEKNKLERQKITNELVQTNKIKTIKSSLFDQNYELTTLGILELDRLLHLVQKNPNWNIEINTIFNHYKEDTLQSSPELTQVMRDTIRIDSAETIKLTYHNNKSEKLQSEVVEYLKSKKIPENRYKCTSSYEALKPGDEDIFGYITVNFK